MDLQYVANVRATTWRGVMKSVTACHQRN